LIKQAEDKDILHVDERGYEFESQGVLDYESEWWYECHSNG